MASLSLYYSPELYLMLYKLRWMTNLNAQNSRRRKICEPFIDINQLWLIFPFLKRNKNNTYIVEWLWHWLNKYCKVSQAWYIVRKFYNLISSRRSSYAISLFIFLFCIYCLIMNANIFLFQKLGELFWITLNPQPRVKNPFYISVIKGWNLSCLTFNWVQCQLRTLINQTASINTDWEEQCVTFRNC